MVASGVPSSWAGRGRQAVELGEVLLAGEHELGGRERLGELAGPPRDPPGIDARERRAEQDRGPDPAHIEEGQLERRAAIPGQRLVHEHEERRRADREEAQAEGPLRGERRGRDQDGRQEQHRERVLQTARQVEEAGELEDVEGQEEGRRVVAQAMARRVLDPQREVHPGRGRDEDEARAEAQGKAEAEMHHRDRRGLADDGEPAQAHEGVEPQMTGVEPQVVEGGLRHVGGRELLGSQGRRPTALVLRVCAMGWDGCAGRATAHPPFSRRSVARSEIVCRSGSGQGRVLKLGQLPRRHRGESATADNFCAILAFAPCVAAVEP
jgi:hypothetical protein